ncbi:MAG: hypothetical protein ABSG32_21460 [Terriglobia bacterium]|jgi:hypothetical protein
MARTYKELQAKMDRGSIRDNKRRVRAELKRMALKELRGANQLALRDEAREVFVNSILNPPAPNKAVRMAAARYKKDVGR